MTARDARHHGYPGVRAVMRSLCGAAIVAGCHRTPEAGAAPSLRSLTPNKGDITQGQVVEVIVHGQGFDSLNTVNFGELVLRQVPRQTSKTLRFTVPLDDVQRPGRGEAPPARLAGGIYAVRVNTGNGASNALSFTLLNGQGVR